MFKNKHEIRFNILTNGKIYYMDSLYESESHIFMRKYFTKKVDEMSINCDSNINCG